MTIRVVGFRSYRAVLPLVGKPQHDEGRSPEVGGSSQSEERDDPLEVFGGPLIKPAQSLGRRLDRASWWGTPIASAVRSHIAPAATSGPRRRAAVAEQHSCVSNRQEICIDLLSINQPWCLRRQ
jgi:hypothetical protein